jgi:hypothetical protein
MTNEKVLQQIKRNFIEILIENCNRKKAIWKIVEKEVRKFCEKNPHNNNYYYNTLQKK